MVSAAVMLEKKIFSTCGYNRVIEVQVRLGEYNLLHEILCYTTTDSFVAISVIEIISKIGPPLVT